MDARDGGRDAAARRGAGGWSRWRRTTPRRAGRSTWRGRSRSTDQRPRGRASERARPGGAGACRPQPAERSRRGEGAAGEVSAAGADRWRSPSKRRRRTRARILGDDDWIGHLFRHPDILKPGAHYYVVHLFDDARGPIRVHDRSRVREATEDRAAALAHLQGGPPRAFRAPRRRDAAAAADETPQGVRTMAETATAGQMPEDHGTGRAGTPVRRDRQPRGRRRRSPARWVELAPAAGRRRVGAAQRRRRRGRQSAFEVGSRRGDPNGEGGRPDRNLAPLARVQRPDRTLVQVAAAVPAARGRADSRRGAPGLEPLQFRRAQAACAQTRRSCSARTSRRRSTRSSAGPPAAGSGAGRRSGSGSPRRTACRS